MKKVIGVLLLAVLFTSMGVLAGFTIGYRAGQFDLFYGAAQVLDGSNTNITINLNETKIIEGTRKIAEEVWLPAFREALNLTNQTN